MNIEYKEIYKNIFHTQFPLTGNPLKSINIYVVKTDDGNLIVDTGFNNEEVKMYMDQMLVDLDLDLDKTALFLTHLHSDHVGLAKYLENKGISKIYISEVDGEIVEVGIAPDGLQWQMTLRNAHRQGLGVDNLKLENHPGFIHRPKEMFNYTPLRPGDKISLSEFNFTTLDESGHTPGMLGLYEEEKGILFCGDHILGKITPNITFWDDSYGDSLGTYMKNINKLKDMHIEHLFSSHRELVPDVSARVDELLHHHKERLEDTLQILRENGEMTTRDVAARMKWSITAKDWDDFPVSQKWFASGEAASHLIHLTAEGILDEKFDEDGVAYYSIKNEE